MAKQCPVGMENIPEMQEIYSWYPSKDRNYLNNAVLAWQEYKKVDESTYPKDKRNFSLFLQKTLNKVNTKDAGSDIKKKDLIGKYLSLYNTFTPQQLQDRIEMLANDFSERINDYIQEHPNVSREDAIKLLGGVKGIFRLVKYDYDFANVEEFIEFNMEGRSESERNFVTQRAKEIFPFYRQIVDNFDQLAALTCNILTDTEKLKSNYSGIEIDIDRENEDDIEAEKEDSGMSDRYVDSRTILQEDTLSVRVKRLIRSIPRRKQDNGIDVKTGVKHDPYVRDEMHSKKFMNPIEVHTTLLSIISKSTPESFMQDIRDNMSRYPWLKDLYDRLVSDPEMRTEVFCAYSRDEAKYVSLFGYGEDEKMYHTSIDNRADTRSSLMNNIRRNLRGLELNSAFKMYDGHGSIVMTENECRNALDIINKIKKNWDLYWNPKKDGEKKYEKYSKHVAESTEIPVIADMLRGIGFDISDNQLRVALLVKADSKFDQFHDMSRWSAIIKSLEKIYKSQLQNKKPTTGEGLLIKNSADFDIIARAVKPGFADDVESRVVKEGKTLSTYQNRTLIRQIIKEFNDFANELNAKYPYERTQNAERKEAISQFIRERFGKYEGYVTKNGKVPGIERFLHLHDNLSSKYGKPVDVYDFTEFNGKEYADMSPAEKLLAGFMMFKNGYFEVPIQADYNVNYFIDFGRTSTKDILNALVDEVKLEIDRIDAINKRINDKDRISISTYDGIEYDETGSIKRTGNGLLFQTFPEFNINGFLDRYKKAIEENPSSADDFIRKEINKQLENILADDIRQAEADGLFKTDLLKDAYKDGKWEDVDMKNDFIEYSMTHMYYQMLMSRVVFGGKAFFKNTEDSEKRQMMAHAPVVPLDTSAEWDGKRAVSDNERVIYVNDNESASAYMEQINTMLTGLQKEGYITEQQKKDYLKAYSGICSTDGQVFRTMKSMREVRIGLGLWNNQFEDAYNRIMESTPGNIKYTKADVRLFMTSILKPRTAGFEEVEVKDGVYVRNPIFHKCSEAVLLPPALFDCLQQKSPVLRAMSIAAYKNGIDAYIFKSAVKTGLFGNITLSGKDRKEIANHITDECNRAGVIHTIPLKYYGLSSSTPVHLVNQKRAWVSQAEKNTFADINDDNEVQVSDGVKMNAKDAKTLYYKIKTAEIVDAYKELERLFDSPQELERVLQEELATKSYNSPELRYMLTLLSDGKFALPIFNPATSRSVQQLFNSIIRKRMTRIKNKGGAVIQETSFGYDYGEARYDNDLPDSEKLHIKFSNDGKRIEYIECYMPIFDSRLERFLDSDGEIKPDRLKQLVSDGIIDPKILEFIGYRTPSDAIHSILPIRVKGFIANIQGASIMLPKEVQVMTGNDFDVDKLLVHFREFTVSEWDEEAIRKAYDQARDLDTIRFILGQTDIQDMPSYELFRRNIIDNEIEKFRKTRLSAVKYDWTKNPEENSQVARSNAEIDLMFGTLTSEDGSRRMFVPGGFETVKRIGKALRILRMSRSNQKLADSLADHDSYENALNYLMSLDSGELNRIINDLSTKESAYSLGHSIRSFYNMVKGKKMIARYALYNTGLAQLQGTGIQVLIDDKHHPFVLFGHRLSVLDGTRNRKGGFISKVFSELINAATDNGKDPLLGILNQNEATYDESALMAAGGFTIEDIMLFMGQPVIRELAKRISSAQKGSSIDDLVIDLASELSNDKSDIVIKNDISSLSAEDFITYSSMDWKEITDSDDDTIKKNQLSILFAFNGLRSKASDLNTIIQSIRPDAATASIQQTIGETQRLQEIKHNFVERYDKGLCSLYIPKDLLDTINSEADVDMYDSRKYLNDTLSMNNMPSVYALNVLMMEGTSKFLERYFPNAKKNWKNVIKSISRLYKNKPTKNSFNRIANDMILWKLLSSKRMFNGNLEDIRTYYIDNVPKQLRDLKESIAKYKEDEIKPGSLEEKLSNNLFLQKLEIERPTEYNPTPRILLHMNGAVSGTIVQSLRVAWSDLYHSGNAKLKKLATDLFIYNLFTNGFNYSMYSFAQIAPIDVQMSCPGYINAMNEVLDSEFSEDELAQFSDQYICNHWFDPGLVERFDNERWSKYVRSTDSTTGLPIFRDPDFDLMHADEGTIKRYEGKFIMDEKWNLYKLKELYGHLVCVEYPKLGEKGRRGQLSYTYQPGADAKDIRVWIDKEKSAWPENHGMTAEEKSIANSEPSDISGYDNSWVAERSSIFDQAWGIPANIRKPTRPASNPLQLTEAQPTSFQDEIPMPEYMEPIDSETDNYSDTLDDTPQNMESNAVKANEENAIKGTDDDFNRLFGNSSGPFFSLADESETNGIFSVSLQQAISTGDWKDSDISELDEIINGIENGTINYKRFPPEASEGLHRGGRIHEAASVILAGKGGTDQTEPLSVSERYERDSRQQPVQENIIESWAKAQGVWYEDLNDAVKGKTLKAQGGEAAVYANNGDTVTKLIGTGYFITPQFALDRITLHNALFPDTTMILKGFGRDENGDFILVVDQPFVEGTTPSMQEIREFVEKAGFMMSEDSDANTYTNESIYLSDLHDENVIKTPQGNLVVIDVDARLNTSDLGSGGTYQINDSIERTNGNETLLAIAERGTDEKGKPVTRIAHKRVTPKTVEQMRKQDAYVKLNKYLRELFLSKGIAVGVLTQAERLMAMNGITDFDTAKIVAEGLIEMIRIREGVAGEMALPEEFAHLAVAMLGYDNPLVSRLINALSSSEEALKQVFGSQYEQYLNEYGNDMRKMAVEAAGKLVAEHMLRQTEMTQKTPFRSLLQRVIAAIKKLFSRFNADSIRNAIQDADYYSSRIAEGILDGTLADELSQEKITESGSFNSLKNNIDKQDDVLSRILKLEMKRVNVLSRREAYGGSASGPSASVIAAQANVDYIKTGIAAKAATQTIVKYLGDAMTFMSNTEAKIDNTIAAGLPMNRVCRRLNTVRDVIYSYAEAVRFINDAIDSGEAGVDASMIQDILDKVTLQMNKFNRKYHKIALAYFTDFLRKYYGDEIKIQIGPDKGKTIKIEELAKYGSQDISMINSLFQSLADTNDLVNKAFDMAVKEARFTARQKSLETKRRIENALRKLKAETGSDDQSFMFERDDAGNRTGLYINSVDARKLTKAQRDFYNEMMAIKKDCDSLLPSILISKDLQTIKVMKSTMQRVKESGDVKSGLKTIGQSIKETFLDTSDDLSYDTDEVIVDFEGNRVDMLPVKFMSRPKGATEEDVTEDVASSMMAYSDMAYDYGEMNRIIGTLENAKYMAGERDIQQKSAGRRQQETIEDEDTEFTRPLTKKQIHTNINRALEAFFQMHVYGHMTLAEGTIGNTRISKRKVASWLNSVTSFTQMGLNIPMQISNITTGGAQIMTELIGGGYYNGKDVAWASKIYGKNVPDMTINIGNQDNDNKLSLFCEMFDIQQENSRTFRGKVKTGRLFNLNVLYAGLTFGEHILSSISALAIAHRTLLKDASGKSVNLYDAMDVKYDDPVAKTGAKLVLKPGVTKADGSAFTERDMKDFSTTVATINFRLQGIYNLNDKSAVQQYSMGALVIMYRKWIAPLIARKYGQASYNMMSGKWQEGYYRTTGRFLLNCMKDLNHLGTTVSLNWESLNAEEKSNIKRAICEIGCWIGTFAALTLMNIIGGDDDDKKELGWVERMTVYQLYKLKNEVGAMMPGPMMVNEALKILNSPFAAIRTITSMVNLLGLLWIPNWTTMVKSGTYKGHSKAFKILMEAPYIGIWRNIDKTLDQTRLINYYRNGL